MDSSPRETIRLRARTLTREDVFRIVQDAVSRADRAGWTMPDPFDAATLWGKPRAIFAAIADMVEMPASLPDIFIWATVLSGAQDDGAVRLGQVKCLPIDGGGTSITLDTTRDCQVLDDVARALREAVDETTAVSYDQKATDTIPDLRPKVPQRLADYRRWHLTWFKVRPWWDDAKFPNAENKAANGTYEKLVERLRNKYPELACGRDTLRAIIKAGLAGLLDGDLGA